MKYVKIIGALLAMLLAALIVKYGFYATTSVLIAIGIMLLIN